jgi:fructose-bisphosphate aldolase class II/tagatose 1,6-diphosphate aldolase GatY/KbaY
MTLRLPIDELVRARAERRAIAAFSVYNLEQTRAVCAAADAARRPILVQAGVSAFAYAGREPLAALALASARSSTVDVGVHLDHARDAAEIRACLALGYTSVMFDGSALPLAENIRVTRAVVDAARATGAWVEAELAGIAGDEDRSQAAAAGNLTDPTVAEHFVEATGVHALAVAIGNVHGIPRTPVHLDLELLRSIAARVHVPLVLHGASGLPDDEVAEAIELGVAKINVNTELRRALRSGLGRASADHDDLPSLLGPAMRAVEEVAAEMILGYARSNRVTSP